ncbi:MAG: hypothetical protein ACXAB4_12260, partial [Candidatus Hodarchaeales archaeon]
LQGFFQPAPPSSTEARFTSFLWAVDQQFFDDVNEPRDTWREFGGFWHTDTGNTDEIPVRI